LTLYLISFSKKNMKKNKFNWSRFYDELEGANPDEFPFHVWVTHEICLFLSSCFSGLCLALLITFLFWTCVFPIVSSFLLQQPDTIKKMCQTNARLAD
jgi:hypothetical protein